MGATLIRFIVILGSVERNQINKCSAPPSYDSQERELHQAFRLSTPWMEDYVEQAGNPALEAVILGGP